MAAHRTSRSSCARVSGGVGSTTTAPSTSAPAGSTKTAWSRGSRLPSEPKPSPTLLLRFQEVEDRYTALGKELRRSKNQARNLKSLQSFVHWVEGAEAIGDYDSLLGRAHAEIDRIEGLLAEGQADKIELVERAEALAESNKWRLAGEAMDELMEEWKRAGTAGREQDEALWQRFKEARRTFFNRRNAHFAELKQSRTAAREAKEALIVRAGELAPSTDYDGTFTAMQDLLEEWKRAGSAGRDIDEQLWERFYAVRDPFFERRKAHLAEQRRRQGGGARGSGGGRRDTGGRAAASAAARAGAATAGREDPPRAVRAVAVQGCSARPSRTSWARSGTSSRRIAKPRRFQTASQGRRTKTM